MELNKAKPDDKKMDNDERIGLGNFKLIYKLTQLIGLAMVILMICWIFLHLDGFGWTSNPGLEFNWHPLLMTIGLIYFYGNAILIYRGCRKAPKKKLKIAHATLHSITIILVVISLKTVFDSHNLPIPSVPNLYSLHSWLGLTVVILYIGQFLGGFLTFLYPGASMSKRAASMPYHIYFGLLLFILTIATALIGLTEKAIFKLGKTYSNLPSSAIMINIIGVVMVIFGALVVYLATEPSYKRKPIPEDAMLLANTNE